MRFLATLLVLMVSALSVEAVAADVNKATLYKNPECGCCEGHAAYLARNGFDVTVVNTNDLSAIKKQYEVPTHLEGCHTTLVGGYVVEGHVPISILNRLLSERPDIRGISLPGMPEGSPGMTGEKVWPFVIFEITDGELQIYAVE